MAEGWLDRLNRLEEKRREPLTLADGVKGAVEIPIPEGIEDEVSALKETLSGNKISQRKLAKELGWHEVDVSRLLNTRIWKKKIKQMTTAAKTLAQ